MLEASDTTPLNAPDAPLASDKPEEDSLQTMRALIERMQGELQFKQSRIEALNFEIARLKRWRFGSSSESLDSTQAVLFDALVLDTALEDRAAQGEAKAPGAVPSIKRQAVRQALPANLPRIDKHYEIDQTHCACGQAFKRIGQEVSEQLDCVPAQFFVLRHIRGKYACVCCQTIQAAPLPAQIIDLGLRRRACWRKWWWPSTTTICRCTGKARFMHAQGCISRARAWRSGWASAGCACSRWPRR